MTKQAYRRRAQPQGIIRGRYLKAHGRCKDGKRFAKLMPGFFDYEAGLRQAREEAIGRENELLIKAALAKVYGTGPVELAEAKAEVR